MYFLIKAEIDTLIESKKLGEDPTTKTVVKQYLVEGVDTTDATAKLYKYLENEKFTFEVGSVSKTKIVEVIE